MLTESTQERRVVRGAVADITFTPEVLYGGESSAVRLTLAAPARTATAVAIRNTSPELLHAPGAVIVPAGAQTITFIIAASGSGPYRLRAEQAGFSVHLFLDRIGPAAA